MKFIFLLALFFIGSAFAASFPVSIVKVNCEASERCVDRRNRFENLVGEYRSLIHLKDTLKIMASDGGYRSFSYVINRIDASNELVIDLELKPIIKEINVGFTDKNLEADAVQLMTIKEGEAFEIQRLQESIAYLQKRLEGLGYPDNKVEYDVNESVSEVKINTVVTLGEARIFKGTRSNATSPFVRDYLERKFVYLYNKPFDFTRFKLQLDDAQKELFAYGYFLLNLEINPIMKGHRVTLELDVNNDRPFAFDFQNLKKEARDVLHAIVSDLFRKYKRPLTESVLKQSLVEHYRNKALLMPVITVETERYKNSYQEEMTVYRISIMEGEKTRMDQVTFTGSSFYKPEKLRKLFDREAFELASAGFYDEEYLNYFAGFLRNRYVQNGFVQVKVQDPIKNIDQDKQHATIDYIISEGPRAYVRSISFEGIPTEFEAPILKLWKNQVSRAFNPIALVEDFKKVATFLQENGFYFAEILNADEENAVTYSRSGTDVDIRLAVKPGPILRLNRVILIGNNKTRNRVIMKKVPLETGDLITPTKTRDIESALSSTGLFNSVTVTPLRNKAKNATTDLIIKMSERDFGLVEIAPGFRTDIGLKLTGTISYLNIAGRNMSITLRSQINQRLSYQSFDKRRRQEHKSLLEYLNNVTFNMGDIFDTKIDYSAGFTVQRKRFYSFDADIIRINNTFTRDLTKKLSSSIRHQFERIKQWDATQPKDNVELDIGAITPSLTFDLRNSQVNPVSGAFFNLSCEFANPYFGSQNKPDLTIDYYKLISRNRFYIPLKRGTIAISMVAGLQENLARGYVRDANGNPVEIQETVKGQVYDTRKQTVGYIPNIKVFRLTGMDIVRGFSDEEINKLPDRRDISDTRVQNKAYLALMKIEPRFFVNDSLMTGVFLDAGRVYVDQVNFGELRSSAGITFKIVTPVGTLDFDYGFKLLRKRNLDGRLEDPGRFHVSIGFF